MSYEEIEKQLPDYVREKLREYERKYKTQYSTLVMEYWSLFKDPWLQEDPSFKTDRERHLYALRLLKVKLVSKPQTREFRVIPFGYTEPRISQKTKVPVSRIYALVKKGEKWEKAIILCKEQYSELWKEIDLMPLREYRVRLFEGKNFLHATSDTRFEEVRSLTIDPIQFLEKYIGVKKFKLIDVYKNLSRTRDGGKYVDDFDLKAIDGFVLRYHRGQRPDGTTYAFYVVSDDSVGEEEQVDEEGRVIPTELTVWIPSSLMVYDVNSELYFYGTVRVVGEEDNMRPIMNAIGLYPIHAKRIPLR